MRRSILVVPAVLGCLAAATARAEVRSKTIEYEDGEVKLKGYLAWKDGNGKRPGVLVVHEWWGLNEYARKRADMLAELGYVAFAADMYGEGKVTEHPREAAAWANEIRENVAAWRRRAQRGIEALRQQENVDPQRIAAIGYCFGGATVMELAYSGADIQGVVSFHGSLPLPPEGEDRKIGPKVLVFHGAADAFVPRERVESFQKALEEVGTDWHMVIFGGARHSFTNPAADKAGLEGLAYNEEADRRSWDHMLRFFRELWAEEAK